MNEYLFSDLEISEPLMRAVEDMGFTKATEIQAKSIPVLCAGHDFIGRSQTGTGKTVAFAIPVIEAIDLTQKNTLQAVILCPTRELAMQATAEIRKLIKYKPGIKVLDVYGGAPMNRQILALKQGVNIVVGTPGRIMDHLRRRTLKMGSVKMVVLDEADEMLSMGFKEDIEIILEGTPETRQTILFSATMPPAILALTKQFQKDPQMVEIDKKQVSVKAIRQSWYDVPPGRKMDALSLILHEKQPKLALIFCNTKAMTEQLSEYLSAGGFTAAGLHGDMKQPQRTAVLNSFKNGRISILVATDVAARGIDVENVEYVINYDIPQNVEYYIHRIGRTGRAGRSGNAITLCAGRRQRLEFEDMARHAKAEATRENLPTSSQVGENRHAQAESKLALYLSEKKPAKPAFTAMLERLQAADHSAEDIALALMQLHFGNLELTMEDITFSAQKRDPQRDYGKRTGGSGSGGKDYRRLDPKAQQRGYRRGGSKPPSGGYKRGE